MKLEQKTLEVLISKKPTFSNVFQYIVSELSERYLIDSTQRLVVENFKILFDHKLCVFNDLVDFFCDAKVSAKCSLKLKHILKNQKLCEILLEKEYCSVEDFDILLKKAKEFSVLHNISKNICLLNRCLSQNLVGFCKLIDIFKQYQELHSFLASSIFLSSSIKDQILTRDNLQYLMTQVTSEAELHALCNNTMLINKILNNFILTDSTLSMLNSIVKRSETGKQNNLSTFSEYLKYFTKNFFEYSKLLQLSEYLIASNAKREDREQFCQLLAFNDYAKDSLKTLLDYGVTECFDFADLKQYVNRLLEYPVPKKVDVLKTEAFSQIAA